MDLLLGAVFLGLGAILGSFIGVVAERINTGQSWTNARSRCNSCSRPLTGRDLVPVLSWLIARGRCFTCGSRIPASYMVMEAVLASLFLFSYLLLGPTLHLAVLLLALSVLMFIVVYDLKHTVVPTIASNLLIALGAAMLLITSQTTEALAFGLVCAGAIGLMFFLLHVLSGGRAMGLGDAPVALALSLLCAPYAVGGLLLSFWIGGVVGVGILVLRQGGPRMGIEVPFVPFLALGYLSAYFFTWNPLSYLLY